MHEPLAVAVVHSFTEDAVRVVPEPAVSLLNGVIVWAAFHEPVLVSFVATGAGTTVGVMVEDAFCPRESVDWYVAEPARPVKGVPEQPTAYDTELTVRLPDEVLHGVKVTEVPETTYTPWPGTMNEVAVQFGDTCPDEQSRIAVDPPEYEAPDDAVSFASGVNVCMDPCAPEAVSAEADAGSEYRPLTTPPVPTASATTGEVEVPETAADVPRDEPVAPDCTVADLEVCVADDGKDTLYDPGARKPNE